MSEYQKNGDAESSRWRTTQDEFRGYVRHKIEDISEELKDNRRKIVWLETKAQLAIGGTLTTNVIIGLALVAKQLGLW